MSTDDELAVFERRVIEFRDQRRWDRPGLYKNLVLYLVVEIGELAEHFIDGDDEQLLAHIQQHRAAIADELVDTLYWLLIISHDFGYNLATEFRRKMVSNLQANKAKGFTRLQLSLPKEFSSFAQMVQSINQFRQLRGWAEQVNPRDIVLKMVEEVGELAVHLQWKNQNELRHHLTQYRQAVADEIVDVLICVLLLFHHLGLVITDEFDRKMAQNAVKYPPR